jgi:hypothetical protein
VKVWAAIVVLFGVAIGAIVMDAQSEGADAAAQARVQAQELPLQANAGMP